MILWLWTNIAVREKKLICYQSTLCDSTCSNTCNGCCLWELCVNEMNKFLLYERAKLWIGKSLAVVCVDW